MTPLIIGDVRDVHVGAIVAQLVRHGCDPVVIDAKGLSERPFELRHDMLVIDGREVDLSSGRGWLRRYSPSGWVGGSTRGGGHDAFARQSFLSVVGSISRLGRRRWLTPVDRMQHAEDRLIQLEAARSLGICVPHTLIATAPERIVAELGPRFLVKQLTGGYYFDEAGEGRVLFATPVDAKVALQLDFAAAAVASQELVQVRRHVRVVTVESQAWVAELEAAPFPTDWRRAAAAHRSWTESDEQAVMEPALLLAATLGVGYSSQDWLQTDSGLVFLDLNPAGQWMFLPARLVDEISNALGCFLANVTDD